MTIETAKQKELSHMTMSLPFFFAVVLPFLIGTAFLGGFCLGDRR